MCKIGTGEILLDDSLKKLFKEKTENVFLRYWRNPFSAVGAKSQSVAVKPEPLQPGEKINRKETYILKEEGNRKNYTIATCCNPIPGDDVLGYVNENEEVIVHKRQCPIAMRLKSSFGQRLVEARWDEHSDYSFPAVIEIKGIDGVGVLNEITRVISGDMSVNIKTLKIDTQDGLFQGILGIMVHDVKDVENLCTNIKKVQNVKSANRISM